MSMAVLCVSYVVVSTYEMCKCVALSPVCSLQMSWHEFVLSSVEVTKVNATTTAAYRQDNEDTSRNTLESFSVSFPPRFEDSFSPKAVFMLFPRTQTTTMYSILLHCLFIYFRLFLNKSLGFC